MGHIKQNISLNMLFLVISVALSLTTAASIDGQSGCLFDGKVYGPGQEIVIANCLGSMTCLGNNNYGNLVQWGGVCPDKNIRSVNGQDGCYFDGKVYTAGDQIVFGSCLGSMMCSGNNVYTHLQQWGGICPTNKESRDVDGQSGCLFDGKVYAPQEDIIIPNCLGKMKCLGNNNLGQITLMGGVCESTKRGVDGQSGCWFDGRVYSAGETINIGANLEPLQCLGHNLYATTKNQ